MKDYYRILGIDHNASPEEIEALCKTLEEKYADQPEKLREIKEAAAVVGPTSSRWFYDRVFHLDQVDETYNVAETYNEKEESLGADQELERTSAVVNTLNQAEVLPQDTTAHNGTATEQVKVTPKPSNTAGSFSVIPQAGEKKNSKMAIAAIGIVVGCVLLLVGVLVYGISQWTQQRAEDAKKKPTPTPVKTAVVTPQITKAPEKEEKATATPRPISVSKPTAKPTSSVPTSTPKPTATPKPTPTPQPVQRLSMLDPSECVTFGDSREKVLELLGEPDSESRGQMVYGDNKIYIDIYDEVCGWWMSASTAQILKVYAGTAVPGATFTIGSTKEEVARANGTPTGVRTEWNRWDYGYSNVNFDQNDKVISWSTSKSDEVALNAYICDAQEGATFTFGSDLQDVFRANGTPDEYDTEYRRLRYGYSSVYFDEEKKVIGWRVSEDEQTELRIRKAEIVPGATFTIGSTKEEVVEANGIPMVADRSTWEYGQSTVSFGMDGYVTGWHQVDQTLAASLGEKVEGAVFGFGSTRDEVVAANGTPTMYSANGGVLYYGNTRVYLDQQERVDGWYIDDQTLNLVWGKAQKGYTFTLGSDMDTVARAMGAPTRANKFSTYSYWTYGYSSVSFDENGLVKEWSISSSGTALSVDMGPMQEGATFQIGSTMEEVVAANGTPTSVYNNGLSWMYGTSVVRFGANRKVEYFREVDTVLNVTE